MLGENFALPRTVYVTHIPAILLVTGFISWIAGDETGMVLAAAVGGAVSLYLMWDWLLAEGPTRLSTIMAMTLLLGYGLGAVNTWLTLPRGGLTVAQFFGGDEGNYARGMAMVLMVSAVLCLVGELYERPVFGSEFRLPLDQRTYVFIVLGTVAVIGGFLSKSVGYGGAQTSGERLSVASALITWMFPPLTALTVAVFLSTHGRFLKTLTGICALILWVLLMVTGRRNLIYTAMLAFFSLRLTGYRLRGTFYRKAFLITAALVFLFVGVNAFMLLRLAGWQFAHGQATLVQRIEMTVSWVEDGSAFRRATDANQANAEKRTFVLAFFADVLNGSMSHTPALGQDAAGYTVMAIPRVLYPDKPEEFGEEGLADDQFGLTYGDAPNSLLTNGATDFGIIGVFAYPLLMVGVFRFIVGVISRILPVFSLTFITLGMIFVPLQTESHIQAYLVTIRNVIIFSFILGLFALMPRISLRNQ